MVGKGASDFVIVAADGGVSGAHREGERLHGDDGTLDQGGIVGKRNCLGNESGELVSLPRHILHR